MEFGFKKNSNFFLNFSSITAKFIFGLATSSELTKISIQKDNPKYCESQNSLSELQYTITNDTAISGKIQSRTVLTPYIFCCNETSTYTLSLNFLNGKNNLDYRCSDSIIYTISIGLIFLVLFSFLRIFLSCHLKENNIFYYILVDLFFVFFIKDLMNSFILILSSENEFFSNSETKVPFGFFPSFILSIIELLSYVLVISELLIVFLFNFAFNKKKPTGFCHVRLYITFQTLIFVLICSLQHVESNWKTYFTSFFLYLLFSYLVLSVPITFSMTKLGIVIDLIGNCFTFNLRNMLIKETNGLFGTQIVFVWLNLISLASQIASTICFLIGFFICSDLRVDENNENIHDSNFDILLDA